MGDAQPEITSSFTLHPSEVVAALESSTFRYPRISEAEQYRGWSKFSVIPYLYAKTARERRALAPDEIVPDLMLHITDPVDVRDPMIVGRARKLAMDFLREAHTLGLLQFSSEFGCVSYQKALDIRWNVDYAVRLLNTKSEAGIQAAMRANWSDDGWTGKKEVRRENRGDTIIDWKGKVYWLTNRHLAHIVGPNSCWLFSETHIHQLASDIKHDNPSGFVGANMQLDLEF